MAELKAHNVTDVFRYAGPPGWGKTIMQAEYDMLIAAGIRVYVVFEQGTNDSAGGFGGGVSNARLALSWLPVGYPGDYPIFMAADENLIGPALVTAVDYIHGASTVLGPQRTGDYGPGALCQATHDAGWATKHWQSASTSFNGNAHALPITQVQQGLAGPLPGTDLDIILAPLVVPPSTLKFPSELFAMLASHPGFAVRFLYRFALHREVDGAGFTANVNWLNAGGDLNTVLANLQDSGEGQAVITAERKLLGI